MSDIILTPKTRKLGISVEVSMARGARLKQLRGYMNLTREEFEAKHGISAGTLRGWEDGIQTSITEKNIARLMPVFQAEGIQCTPAWLLHGEGIAPVIQTANIAPRKNNEDIALTEEIAMFCKNHPGAMYMQVMDDGMAPHYEEGDYVAGSRLTQSAMRSAIGLESIVEMSTGELLFRIVRRGTKAGFYTLQCSNSATTVSEPTLYDVDLLSAAPVVWHRRIGSS